MKFSEATKLGGCAVNSDGVYGVWQQKGSRNRVELSNPMASPLRAFWYYSPDEVPGDDWQPVGPVVDLADVQRHRWSSSGMKGWAHGPDRGGWVKAVDIEGKALVVTEPCKESAAKDERIKELEDENTKLKKDMKEAATDLLVPIPEPGSHLAKAVSANVLLRQEREGLREKMRELNDALIHAQGERDGWKNNQASAMRKLRKVEAELAATKEEKSEWVQAVGLLSTLSKFNIVDPDNPLKMAKDLEKDIRNQLAEARKATTLPEPEEVPEPRNVCGIRNPDDGSWWQCNTEHGTGWTDRIRQSWTYREAQQEIEDKPQWLGEAEIVELVAAVEGGH